MIVKRVCLFLLLLMLVVSIVGCSKDSSTGSRYSLSITKEGEGTVEPAEGIYQRDEDAVVSLSVTADTANGWYFSEWGGPDGSEVSGNKILMDGDKSITAIFSKSEYGLNITITPEDAGQVDAVTLPVLQSIEHGETVRLTAAGNKGYVFDHWEGDLTGSTNPVTLTMDGAKNVTAVYVRALYGRVTGRNSTEGIEGITVNFSDGSSTVTDSQGYWSKRGVSGTITVIPDVPASYFGAEIAPVNRKVIWPSDDINFTFGGYRFISKWGSEGSGEGQFLGPLGVAVDGSASIYVADTYNNRIQLFESVD